MEREINNFILKREREDELGLLKYNDSVYAYCQRDSIALAITPISYNLMTSCKKENRNIIAKNLLLLNLRFCHAYGHIYSEAFSELFAVDETYPEYDCILTVLTPLMKQVIEFFNLKLSSKIKFIKPSEVFLLNFENLKIVNHGPRAYINKTKNVLNLKTAFHSARPIQERDQMFLIYCSRNSPTGAHGRKLIEKNEIEIIEILKEYAHQKNLEFYLLTGQEPDGTITSISKQYELFSNAKLVVGPHGGVMSNLIFLDPLKNAKIIEFCPSSGKSFNTLFDKAILNFAEYYTHILYQLPPDLQLPFDIELPLDIEKTRLKNQSLRGYLRKKPGTIDVSELKRLLATI